MVLSCVVEGGIMVFVIVKLLDCSVERAMNAVNALAGMLGRKTEESRKDA